MKNGKLMLGVFAFVFAIASAFASKHSLLTAGWEYVPVGPGQPVAECIDRGDCNNLGGNICKFLRPDATTVDLREVNNTTIQCGDVLTHSLNDGIVNPD